MFLSRVMVSSIVRAGISIGVCTVLLVFCGIGRTLCMGAVCWAAAGACLLFPFLIIILPGLAGILCGKIADGVIQKYIGGRRKDPADPGEFPDETEAEI